MSVRPEVRPEAPPPERGGGATGRRRLRVLVVVPVVVLALWGLSRVGRAIALSAPGELPWTAGQRHLVTDPQAPGMYHSALLDGTLVEAPPGRDPACLSASGQGGGATWIVWPHGYRLSARGEVLRGDGTVAARVGEAVQIGGGVRDDSGGLVPGDTCPPGERWAAAP